MNTNTLKRLTRRSLATALWVAIASSAAAQTDKTVVAEPVPAFPAFNQWLVSVSPVQAEAAVSAVLTVPLTPSGAAVEQSYQPLPVILGLPELPLVGAGAGDVSRAWSSTLNYQGIQIRQVVLNAKGTKRELRSMAGGLRSGDRFKIRVTATFDAVAEVDQVVGDAWYGKRTGQVYPQPGLSVQMKAGETVDLPLGANEYFLMNRAANERLIVSVRHASALAAARSDQPAYRQDGNAGSSYLQLVPRGKFPAFEQQVTQAR